MRTVIEIKRKALMNLMKDPASSVFQQATATTPS
jgi:hypothetical protein